VQPQLGGQHQAGRSAADNDHVNHENPSFNKVACRPAAPPDREFAELLAGVGVPLVPAGQPVRPLVAGEQQVRLDAFHYMLREGRMALLFDGFDELALRSPTAVPRST
jgi:hypothetical protein